MIQSAVLLISGFGVRNNLETKTQSTFFPSIVIKITLSTCFLFSFEMFGPTRWHNGSDYVRGWVVVVLLLLLFFGGRGVPFNSGCFEWQVQSLTVIPHIDDYILVLRWILTIPYVPLFPDHQTLLSDLFAEMQNPSITLEHEQVDINR